MLKSDGLHNNKRNLNTNDNREYSNNFKVNRRLFSLCHFPQDTQKDFWNTVCSASNNGEICNDLLYSDKIIYNTLVARCNSLEQDRTAHPGFSDY